MSVSALFRRLPAGVEAIEWGRRYADDLGHAWHECKRGDWLLWLAGILEVDPKLRALGRRGSGSVSSGRGSGRPGAVAFAMTTFAVAKEQVDPL